MKRRNDNNEAMKGKYSVYGDLKNSDNITKNSLLLGVYPGITPKMMDHVIDTLDTFLKPTGLL
jgi:dTDP-4-amino-4,6-dideoxygalactose transaminase